MATVYYEKDADPSLIRQRKVAIIGYGSQGHAHALNLKDSGIDVRVGLRRGSSSMGKAEAAGLSVVSVAQAAEEADVIMILLPDTEQKRVYEADIQQHMTPGKALAFAHGFNVRFGRIAPPEGVDVIMIAPRAPAISCGARTPKVAAFRVSSRSRKTPPARRATSRCRMPMPSAAAARASSRRRSPKRPRPISSVSRSCCAGGSRRSCKPGSRRSSTPAISPRWRTSSALHEVKLIVDLMYEEGIAGMRYSISDTAEYGDVTRGPRIITESTKAEMKRILEEIVSGRFADEWVAESESGRKNFTALRERGKTHPIEKTGAELRSMMPWISAGKQKVSEVSGG